MNGNYNSLITAKNVGIVTILCAATATLIILNQPSSKRKLKKKKQNKLSVALSPQTLSDIQHDLESRRQKILNEFEQSNHKKIPKEMDLAMDYIVNDINTPSLYPPSLRLLASQLIQDYAIMYTNIYATEPSPKIIALAKDWLNFSSCHADKETGTMSINIALQIEQINHRYALALRSKSIKEFKLLYNWLQSININIRTKQSIKQNWILRNFQCCCLLGKWNKVKLYGKELENVKPESLSSNNNNNDNGNNNNKSTTPLHPLHLFEYIALKLPNQSANFTQVYYNVDSYISKFDPMLAPPLCFTEWQIKNCKTIIRFGFSTNKKRHEELSQQIKKAASNLYNANNNSNPLKFMFVYGCLVQFPCFWVQLPASNTKMQPVVLTGPYNDSEMELTASYIRRVPQDNIKNKKLIRVVRSDLRLKLDRGKPFNLSQLNGDEKNNENMNIEENNNVNEGMGHRKTKKWSGWNWSGTFEHEEGLLECNESDSNNFKFRRNVDWKLNALKFTCRAWDCHMVISTPD